MSQALPLAEDNSAVAELVAIGFPPSTAERIVASARAHLHQPLTADELIRDARVTEGDIEAARAWWYFSPTVPVDIKRMLDAPDA